MRNSGAKRFVTIMVLILSIIQFINIQPAFFGVHTYFGLSPIVFVLPVSFISMVFYVLHVYQHWPLMLAWFKRSPDKKKQRDKTSRAVVLIVFMLVITYSISSAWYEALTNIEGVPPIETMRIWSWAGYGLLVIHVWQRWRLIFSYFQRNPRKEATSS